MKFLPESPVFNEKTHDKQRCSDKIKKSELVKYQPKKSTKPILKEPIKSNVSRIPVSNKLRPTSTFGKLLAMRQGNKNTSPIIGDAQSKLSKCFIPNKVKSASADKSKKSKLPVRLTAKSAGGISGTSSNRNSRNTPENRKLMSSKDSELSVWLNVNNVTNNEPLLKHSDSLKVTTSERGVVHPYRRIYSPMFDGTSSEETTRSVLQDYDTVSLQNHRFSEFQAKPVPKANDIEYDTFTLDEIPHGNCFPVIINPELSADVLGDVEELSSKVTSVEIVENRSWQARFHFDRWKTLKTWKTLYALSISSLLVHLVLYSDEYLLSFPMYFPYGWQFSDVL